MPQPYFMLIVEPRLIERLCDQIDHPTDEPLFDRRFVVLVGFSVGREEPFREELMGPDGRAPSIDKLLGVIRDHGTRTDQHFAIVRSETDRGLKLVQRAQRQR
jgi:hypothetical protein